MITAGVAFNNLIWRFLERCGTQLISFGISILLARLLVPEDYGTVAICSVFITILGVFVNCGLGAALVQKKEPDDLDYSSVFYVSLFMGVVLFLLMCCLAPYISNFYERPELTNLIRVLSFGLVISGLTNIQGSYVSKHMMFKKFFYSSMAATLVSAGVGVFMAYNGYGAWALVIQGLFASIASSFVLWYTVPWRPILAFSFSRIKKLFDYGYKLLLSYLLGNVYEQGWQLVIGKFFSPADLAFYNRGSTFPSIVVSNINSSIDSVLLPSMSSVQDDIGAVRNMTRRAVTVSIFVMAPMMLGLAACSDAVITILLTEKWLPAVPFMMIFCINYMFWPVHTANLNAIKAMGRSDIFLKLEIIKKVVGATFIIYFMQYGVLAMAEATLFTGVCSQIINSWPNKKLLNYGYLQQFRDFMPSVLLAAVMGCIVYSIKFFGWNMYITLVVQILTGAVIYISGAWLFKLEPFDYVIAKIKAYRAQRANT